MRLGLAVSSAGEPSAPPQDGEPQHIGGDELCSGLGLRAAHPFRQGRNEVRMQCRRKDGGGYRTAGGAEQKLEFVERTRFGLQDRPKQNAIVRTLALSLAGIDQAPAQMRPSSSWV